MSTSCVLWTLCVALFVCLISSVNYDRAVLELALECWLN